MAFTLIGLLLGALCCMMLIIIAIIMLMATIAAFKAVHKARDPERVFDNIEVMS